MSKAPEPAEAPIGPAGTFRMFGHEDQERELSESLASDRLSHAWLLTGPRQIGKATLAYRAVRAIMGAKRVAGGRLFDFDPDDPICRKISANAHPDFFLLTRGLNDKGDKLRNEISADDARGLGAFLSLSAAEGGWRAVLVDSVDELNRFAANALLKLLEEPPSRTLILLVCHAPGAALATIRSRCRRLRLEPVGRDAVEAAARETALSGEDLEAAIRLAAGRPGRLAEIGSKTGLKDYDLASSVLMALSERPGSARRALLRAEPKSLDRLQNVADIMLDWIARAQRAALGRGGQNVEVRPGEAAAMAKLASPERLDAWAGAWQQIADLAREAKGLQMDPTQSFLQLAEILEAAADRGASRP